MDINNIRYSMMMKNAMRGTRINNWPHHFLQVSELIHGNIFMYAQSAKEAREAIQMLASGLLSIDWEAAFEEKAKQVSEYTNQLLECWECREYYPRKEMSDCFFSESFEMHGICIPCSIRREESHYRFCAICDIKYKYQHNGNNHFCPECRTEERAREAMRVMTHVERAKTLGKQADLTVKQWIHTLNHFENKCAYCLSPFRGLEHYMPLSLGGGTMSNNCLPSCRSCNNRKRDKHPDDFARLFPADNLACIRSYFASIIVNEGVKQSE